MGKKMIRCMGCMTTFSSEYNMCPHCGYVVGSKVENAMHMMPGTLLADRYILGRVVGFGGFGITYIAWDKTLYQKVAIKEYLPSEFSTRTAGQTMVTVFSGDKTIQFQDGMEKFVDEAKRLAKFQNDNGIVRVFDSFEENNTAYIVMEYLEGETLAQYLEREGVLSVEQAITLIMPVIHALSAVHEKGIIHRDIAPDNVFLTTDGKVKLIDFGAARYATTTKSRSLTVIIKPGYSPEEQYRSRSDQGAHTDVYSVGAILYRMITGETPPDALERRAYYEKSKKDILTPIRKYTKNISRNQENAIYNAMNVLIEDRTPDMETLAKELTTEEKVVRKGSTIRKTDPLTWPIWAKFGVPAAIILVTVLVVFVGVRWGRRNIMEIPDGQTMTPNVVAKDTDVAEKRLEASQLGFLISDKIENDVIEKNKILTQDPYAGFITDTGTIVNVVISAGRGDAIVPNVTGMLFDEAKEQLEALGFVVEKKEKKSNEAKDAVLSQSVEENETLEIGSTILLIVSLGPDHIDAIPVTIPKLIGEDLSEAKKKAEGLRLSVIVSRYEYSDNVPEDQVMEQNPMPGESGMTGDSIEIIVSRGAAKLVVPDLYGRKQSAAIQLLESRGIKYKVEYGTDTKVNIDVVFAQSIAAETEIDKNTTVVITVCNNNPVLNAASTTRAATTSTTTKPSSTTTSTTKKEGFTYINPGKNPTPKTETTTEKTTTAKPTETKPTETKPTEATKPTESSGSSSGSSGGSSGSNGSNNNGSGNANTPTQPISSNLFDTYVTNVLQSSSTYTATYAVNDGQRNLNLASCTVYKSGSDRAADIHLQNGKTVRVVWKGSDKYACVGSNYAQTGYTTYHDYADRVIKALLDLTRNYSLDFAESNREIYKNSSSETRVLYYSSSGLESINDNGSSEIPCRVHSASPSSSVFNVSGTEVSESELFSMIAT